MVGIAHFVTRIEDLKVFAHIQTQIMDPLFEGWVSIVSS
jgi:hypothetical protein